MQVTQANAVIVAAIFKSLGDPRFTMRTPGAMTEGGTIDVAKVIDVAAEIGLRSLHRRRDGVQLIVRPAITPDQSLELAGKAMGVAQGTVEPFEVDFSEHEEASIEPAGNDSTAGDDEDSQFN